MLPLLHGLVSRKNFEAFAGMATGFVAPLRELVQLGEERDRVSCKTKPGVFGVQETVAPPSPLDRMVSVGAPGVCTAEAKLQKPPVNKKLPPVIGGPASGWPMVPLTAYTPPVLVPPPPSMVNQSME